MSVKKHPSSWVGCFFMLWVKRLKTQSRFALIIFLPEAFIFALKQRRSRKFKAASIQY